MVSIPEFLVIQSYQLLLNRNPESQECIDYASRLPSVEALVAYILTSPEFSSINQLVDIAPKLQKYSQNGEDIVLMYALEDIESGFYIDIGANDPIVDSVTKLFYDSGWSGINVEPEEVYFRKLVEYRPRDVNLMKGCAAKNGTAKFYQSSTRGWSSLYADNAKGWDGTATYHTVQIEAMTLDSIVQHYLPKGRSIDFLKLDTEGSEIDIIKHTDWYTIRPRIICVESTPIQFTSWVEYLSKAGYSPSLFDGSNYFLVREEDRSRNIIDFHRLQKYYSQVIMDLITKRSKLAGNRSNHTDSSM